MLNWTYKIKHRRKKMALKKKIAVIVMLLSVTVMCC